MYGSLLLCGYSRSFWHRMDNKRKKESELDNRKKSICCFLRPWSLPMLPFPEQEQSLTNLLILGYGTCTPESKYEKLNYVGDGMYGTVYRARNMETGEIVALKQVKLLNEEEVYPIAGVLISSRDFLWPRFVNSVYWSSASIPILSACRTLLWATLETSMCVLSFFIHKGVYGARVLRSWSVRVAQSLKERIQHFRNQMPNEAAIGRNELPPLQFHYPQRYQDIQLAVCFPSVVL